MIEETDNLISNRTILGLIYKELQKSVAVKPAASIWKKKGRMRWLCFIAGEVVKATRACSFDIKLEYWDTPRLNDQTHWRAVTQKLFHSFLINAAAIFTEEPYDVYQQHFYEQLCRHLVEATLAFEPEGASIRFLLEETDQ